MAEGGTSQIVSGLEPRTQGEEGDTYLGEVSLVEGKGYRYSVPSKWSD